MPPFFSIIIPTHNRPERLEACLQAIVHLDYSHSAFEVIIVNDGSRTSPKSAIDTFDDRLEIKLIDQLQSGPAAARNTGAMAARGEYLAFTDDDCAPAADWLKTLAQRFASAPDSLVGGRTINALLHNVYSTASQLLIDYLYHYFNALSGRPAFFASNNLAVPAHQFYAIGGFDGRFPMPAAEDRDFCDRWHQQGYRMVYAPEVTVSHSHRMNLQDYWRQHFNYGRGAYHYHRLRSLRMQSRIRIEPVSFYLNLLLYPFSRLEGKAAYPIAILLVVSQIANAAGFFSQMRPIRKHTSKVDPTAASGLGKNVSRDTPPRL